jgi:solute carrier family 50 (sugar transporter)
MLYGYMDHNIFPVVTTFLTGDICSLLYMAVFYWYTDDRAYANKAIAGFGGATLLSTVYAIVGGYGLTGQSRSGVTLTIGYLCVVATVVLYTSPFEKIGQVLKHRSGVFIPIHMVVAGVLSNAMWLVYAGLVSEWIILAPNAFCFVMGCAQIVVYLVFHPRSHPLVQTDDLEAPAVTKSQKTIQVVESPCFVPVQSPPLAKSQV